MIKTYKCPNCGGQMNFNAAKGALVCDHCGNTMTVQEAGIDDPELYTQAPDEGVDTDGDQVNEYSCPACGARLVTDAQTSSTVCAFCGTGTLLPSRLTGGFKPSRVIPFKVEKKDAQKSLKEWAKSFKLTPTAFQSAAIMDKLVGVYVPFWLYSATATADLSAEGRKIEKKVTDKEEITVTQYFDAERTVKNIYKGVPADASEKMPDEAMEGLEPYDYDELAAFKLPYLSGFQAEKYNNPAEHYEEKVWRSIEEDIIDSAEETLNEYDETTVTASSAKLTNKSHEYVMLPVWSLAYKYGGKTYPVYVNGQTGKIDGTLPLSKGKVAIRFAIFFAVCFIAALLMGVLADMHIFSKWWSWPIAGLVGGGLAALIAKGNHNRRSYTPRRHYAAGEAQMLNRIDRYVRTVTERKELPKKS